MSYKNKEKQRQYQKKYRMKNKDKIRIYQKKYHQLNPEKKKGYHLKHRYGLTLKRHKQMYINQNGCCLICGKSIPYNEIQVDHNHFTNEVRDLLCDRCNSFVGFIETYPELINPVVEYLERHNVHS